MPRKKGPAGPSHKKGAPSVAKNQNVSGRGGNAHHKQKTKPPTITTTSTPPEDQASKEIDKEDVDTTSSTKEPSTTTIQSTSGKENSSSDMNITEQPTTTTLSKSSSQSLLNPKSLKTSTSTSELKRETSQSSLASQGGNLTPRQRKDQDEHPYARGAIIEVLYVTDNTIRLCDIIERAEINPNKGLSTLSRVGSQTNIQAGKLSPIYSGVESSKFDTTVAAAAAASTTTTTTITTTDSNDNMSDSNLSSVPLSGDENTPAEDKPVPQWRYYVHYHNFNRRMDEWIVPNSGRIITPPSVAGAKHRAAVNAEKKKVEEKKRKERESISGASSGLGVGLGEGGEIEALEPIEKDENGKPIGDNASRSTRRTLRKKNEDIQKSNKSSNTKGSGTLSIEGVGSVGVMIAEELDEHEGLDEASLREHEEVTKVKNVSRIELGRYSMETWYFSPLPKELLADGDGHIETLYICESSLNFFAQKEEMLRYQNRMEKNFGLNRHPPGNEIYRNGKLSMFEVDGFDQRLYCQNLCYIAKLFLDHKTLYFDVDPFLFYVLCESDEWGFHPVGYFSKEKYSDVGYNLACILTFPSYQRKGYGRFLIGFSYELSKKEEKVGSPEKPMSDLGQQAYKPYWTSTIINFLQTKRDVQAISIMDISKSTSIMADDIIFTLNQLSLLKFINGIYFVSAEDELLQTLALKHPVKPPFVNPSLLHWTPYLTDVKRDKFSIYNKKPTYGVGGGKVAGTEIDVSNSEFGGGRGGRSGALAR